VSTTIRVFNVRTATLCVAINGDRVDLELPAGHGRVRMIGSVSFARLLLLQKDRSIGFGRGLQFVRHKHHSVALPGAPDDRMSITFMPSGDLIIVGTAELAKAAGIRL